MRHMTWRSFGYHATGEICANMDLASMERSFHAQDQWTMNETVTNAAIAAS
ncbi:MAG: hypothetical protein ACLU8D_13350 [Enterocloster sp.]